MNIYNFTKQNYRQLNILLLYWKTFTNFFVATTKHVYVILWYLNQQYHKYNWSLCFIRIFNLPFFNKATQRYPRSQNNLCLRRDKEIPNRAYNKTCS